MELANPLLMNLLALAAIVSGVFVAAWFIIALHWIHSRKVEDEMPEVDLPGHLHEVLAGVPPAIVLFLIFVAVSMVLYVVYIWAGGISY